MGNCASCRQMMEHMAEGSKVTLAQNENSRDQAAVPETEAACCCKSAAVGENGEMVAMTTLQECIAAAAKDNTGYRSLAAFLAEAEKPTQDQHKAEQVERAATEAKDEKSTAVLPHVEFTGTVEQLETTEILVEMVESKTETIVAEQDSENTIAWRPVPAAEKVAPPPAEKFIAAVSADAKTEKLVTSVPTAIAFFEKPGEDRHVEKFEAAADSVAEMSDVVGEPVDNIELETTANEAADVSETTVAKKLIPDVETVAPKPLEMFSASVVKEAVIVEDRDAAAIATTDLGKSEVEEHVKFETVATSEISTAVANSVGKVESETTAVVAADVSETTLEQELVPDLVLVAPKPAEKFTTEVIEEAETENNMTVERVVEPSVAAATAALVFEQPEEEHMEKLEAAAASEISAAVAGPLGRIESETTAIVAADVSEMTVVQKLIPDLGKVAPKPAEKFIIAVIEEAETEKLVTVERVEEAKTEKLVTMERVEEAKTETLVVVERVVEPVVAAASLTTVAEVSGTTVAKKLIPDLEPVEMLSVSVVEEAATKKLVALVDRLVETSVTAASTVLEQPEVEQHVKFEAVAASEISAAVANSVGRVEPETIAVVAADVSETAIAQELIPDLVNVAPKPAEELTTAVVEETETEKLVTVERVVEPSVAASTATPVVEQPEEEQHVEKFETAAAFEISTAAAFEISTAADPLGRDESEATKKVAEDVAETIVAQKLISEISAAVKGPLGRVESGTEIVAADGSETTVAPKPAEKFPIAFAEDAETEKLVIVERVEEANTEKLVTVERVVESNVTAATATPVVEQRDEGQHVKKFETAVASEISTATADPLGRDESEATANVAEDVSENIAAQKLIPDLEKIAPQLQPTENFLITDVEQAETEKLMTVNRVVESILAIATAAPVLDQPEEEQFEAAAALDISVADADPVKRVESEATAIVGAEISETAVAQILNLELENVGPKPAEKFAVANVEEAETKKLVTMDIIVDTIVASSAATPVMEQQEKKQYMEKFEPAAASGDEISAAVVYSVPKEGDETESGAGTIAKSEAIKQSL